MNQKFVKAKRFNSFGLLISWIIHFKRFKEKCLSKKFYPDQSECREKILISFQNDSIWWECIKMIKMKFTKNLMKKKKKLFSKKFLHWKKHFLKILEEKKFCWIFTLQENFPPRAKKRPLLVKNCHGPRKSRFFATLNCRKVSTKHKLNCTMQS